MFRHNLAPEQLQEILQERQDKDEEGAGEDVKVVESRETADGTAGEDENKSG